jgi:hypothetical protein
MPETIDHKVTPVEDRKEAVASAGAASSRDPAPAAPAKVPIEKIDPKELPKTSGEKFYDVFQFVFGKIFILAVTAWLAFTADQKHGPEKFLGMPNYLKKFQGEFHKKLLKNRIYPLAEKGEFANLFANAAASTMILSHGGNFFAPFIKWLENSKEKISNFYNKRWGQEGEVEIAHERLKDNPQQTWPDVIKGRVIAWTTVFAAMLTAFTVIGKDKKTGMYWLEKYEEKFARGMAGFSKTGKEIAATPVAKELTEAQKAHGVYRFGKVVALDLYATTAGIIIWNIFSRKFAKDRQKPKLKPEDIDTHHDAPAAAEHIASAKHRDKISPVVAGGYAKMAQETRAETTPSLG